jgi:hypothetical protein
LIHIMNSPLAGEKVQAAAVKAVGDLELHLMKLKLARFKARQRREKEATNDPSRWRP